MEISTRKSKMLPIWVVTFLTGKIINKPEQKVQ